MTCKIPEFLLHHEKSLPMGKTFRCHYGTFTFPSEILGVEIHDQRLVVHCEDGDYEVKPVESWEIIKL